MEVITVNQIQDVLEKRYQDVVNKKTTKGILLYGYEGTGRYRMVFEWAEKHKNDFFVCEDMYPEQFYSERNGILYKEEPALYGYGDNQFNYFNKKFVLSFRRLNWGRNINGDEELIKLIRDDVYHNPVSDENHTMENRLFSIATAYRENEGYNELPISSNLLNLFDAYSVEPIAMEQFLYLKDHLEYMIDWEKNQTNNEFAREFDMNYKGQKEIIESLIESNYQVKYSSDFTPCQFESLLEEYMGDKEKFMEMLEEIQAKIR